MYYYLLPTTLERTSGRETRSSNGSIVVVVRWNYRRPIVALVKVGYSTDTAVVVGRYRRRGRVRIYEREERERLCGVVVVGGRRRHGLVELGRRLHAALRNEWCGRNSERGNALSAQLTEMNQVGRDQRVRRADKTNNAVIEGFMKIANHGGGRKIDLLGVIRTRVHTLWYDNDDDDGQDSEG